MHRHGYTNRKFGRERDQRTALMRSLAVALVEHGSIETTQPKAKELRPMIEKLVTKARKADLHARRQIITHLNNITASHKLIEQIAPAMKRTSGYTKIERTNLRRGDNIQLARISFVDPVANSQDSQIKPKALTNETAEKQSKQASRSTKSPVSVNASTPSPATQTTVAPKRTGRRGDR